MILAVDMYTEHGTMVLMKNKKIVVTGGAGFVGSHVVDLLLEKGADVVVLDNLSHGNHVSPDARFYRADVRNVDTCKFFFKDAWAVINCAAAVAGVDWNKDNNSVMFRENVDVLIPPVIAASELGIPHFVQFSSACIYDTNNQAGPTEEQGYDGFTHPANWGYGQAKRDGELAALFWSKLDHAIVVRPMNMYGPRDHFEDEKSHVIPALMKRIDETMPGGKLEVYGYPDTVREFMYVTDCAKAIAHLLENTEGKEVYNIGTGGETAVAIQELVDLISVAMDKPVETWFNVDRGGGDDRRFSNVDKIRATGWTHEVDLESGLRDTVAWYKRYIKEEWDID